METQQQQAAAVASRAKQGEFGWVDLAAADLEAQTRFYEALFGWAHRDVTEPGAPPYRVFTLDGVNVAGASQPQGIGQTMWNTYISADDVDGMTHRAADLGAQVIMQPVDVRREGRLAGIQDPTGAYVFLWKPASEDRGGRFGVPGALMWNDLDTREPEKAAAFYTSLFSSWEVRKVQDDPQPYWMIDVDGQAEGGVMPTAPDMPAEVPAHWLVYFGVEDVYAATERAKSLGGTAAMEPMDVGTVVFSVLADPAGAVFAIMTPPKG